MENTSKKIAIYGKGGIGKSTTSANLSYILGGRGHRVVQIGCDPKHDSTKQLLKEHRQPTVLEYIRNVPPSKRRIEDFAIVGANDVLCIESGGPEPGIGCAGRGILTTFDILKTMGIDDIPKDFTVYDVLGDVVCGGFAVPMRQEYADAIYVVTSGEYMAIYAANNIFKGLLNFGDRPRAAGIILNQRGVKDEVETVKRFAEAVGVPIVATVPRDPVFQEAEKLGKTVCESFPDSVPVQWYNRIADDVESVSKGEKELYLPRPLEEDALEELIFGTSVSMASDKKKDCCDTARYVGVASCASRGAAYAAGRVTDLSVVVHGPSNCGYVMSHTQDNHYLSDIASNPILKVILRNNMVCTGMTNQDFIFGGHFKLTETLESEISKGKKEIMVITTCVSGMIGDNIRKIIDETMVRHPDVHLYPINADGNLIGDSEEGRGLVQDTLIDTIDMGIEPTEDRINLVDTTFMQFNRGRNEKWLRELLEPTGLSVGVKLFEECTMEDVRTCRRNRYFALTSDILANIPIRRKIEKKGFVFMDRPLPSGYRSTLEWLDYVSGLSGHTEGCARTKEIVERQYKAALERFSPYLKGKRVAIAVSSYFNIDWIIELMLDVGMTIDKVYTYAMGPSKRGFYSRYADRLEIVEGMRVSQISEAVSASRPDLVLGNHHVAHESGCRFAKHSQEEITHQASIVYLEYLSNILKVPMGEGWKSWEGGL